MVAWLSSIFTSIAESVRSAGTLAVKGASFVGDVARSLISYTGGSLPSLEDVSLDKLENAISNIDKAFPENIRLKGYAFERTTNDCLGLYPKDNDFTVFAPAPIILLPTDPPKLKVSILQHTRYLSTAQQAFVKTIEEGLKRQDTDTVLIDLATLDTHENFFLGQCDDGSVIGRLAAAVNAVSEKKRVVIRFLSGKIGDREEGHAQLRDRYLKIFWPEVENGEERKPIGRDI